MFWKTTPAGVCEVNQRSKKPVRKQLYKSIINIPEKGVSYFSIWGGIEGISRICSKMRVKKEGIAKTEGDVECMSMNSMPRG